MQPHNQGTSDQWVTASQLAEMGYCERKVVLKQNLGPRISSARKAAQERGIEEHEWFLRSALLEHPSVTASCRSRIARERSVVPSIWTRLLELLRRLFVGTES